MSSETLNCKMIGKCGGCPWADRGFTSQLEEKRTQLRGVFPAAEIIYQPRERVRDRADLIWERTRDGQMQLGLYALGARQVVDLPACPMMSEPLERWFLEFKKLLPPINKGSVRLRVSPSGERGVWLDFANQDVKELFTEREYLQRLSALGFVEIGQRRKALIWRDGQPKLADPVLKPWFETYDIEFQAIPLYGPVGGFTQTGFAANRALISAVAELVAASGVRRWLELFCGNGNFSLALASRGLEVEAVELDELALMGLKLSAAEAGLHLNVQRADVYLGRQARPSLSGRGLLVDPPRAGLRELFSQLEQGERPQALLYVSCFTEVFLQDLQRLKALGYELERLVGVDQFPFSPHCEWIALFK
jgi:23S rRNA (uracil1939-C5)-methyltransferase